LNNCATIGGINAQFEGFSCWHFNVNFQVMVVKLYSGISYNILYVNCFSIVQCDTSKFEIISWFFNVMICRNRIFDCWNFGVRVYLNSDSFWLRDLDLNSNIANIDGDCATGSDSRLLDSLGVHKCNLF
jgi:hypothetical protein